MLKVTQKARQELKKLALLHIKNQDACIRLVYNFLGQLGLVISKPKAGDEEIREQGLPILSFSYEFKRILDGATIDVAYSSDNREFVLTKK